MSSLTIIKANIKQYKQYKSRPLPLTQILDPPLVWMWRQMKPYIDKGECGSVSGVTVPLSGNSTPCPGL